MNIVTYNLLGIDLDRWRCGLTLEQFVDGSTTYRDELRQRLRDVRLKTEDEAFLAQYTDPLYVLALTEDWCGDSLMNLPILARLVEAAPGAALRIVVRGQEPELAAAYRARGVVNIPVFTFFDSVFTEIGTWVERPQAAHRAVKRWHAQHPEVAAIRADPALSDAERKVQLHAIYDGLRVQMEQWYEERLQAATVAELRALLGLML